MQVAIEMVIMRRRRGRGSRLEDYSSWEQYLRRELWKFKEWLAHYIIVLM
jgi:hypothetical protein